MNKTSALGISETQPLLPFPVFARKRLPKVSPALYHAAAKAAAFVAAGAVAYFVYPQLTPPLLVVGTTIVITRLVLKTADLYHVNALEKALTCLARFRTKHKYLQFVGLVAVIALGVFSWKAACILAIPFGIYAAVVIGLDHYVGAQSVRRRQENSGRLETTEGKVFLP